MFQRRRNREKITPPRPQRAELVGVGLDAPENEASCQSVYLVTLPLQRLHPNTTWQSQLMHEILHHLPEDRLLSDPMFPLATPEFNIEASRSLLGI